MSDKDFPKAFACTQGSLETLVFQSADDRKRCECGLTWSAAECEAARSVWRRIGPPAIVYHGTEEDGGAK